MNIPEEKTALRRNVQERVNRISAEERMRQSDIVNRKILELLRNDRHVICGFMPLADEIDILPALREILDLSHALYLPRYEAGTVTFHAITIPEEHLIEGPYGMREPHRHLPLLDPSSLDFVLVPGRAFDGEGKRLGRGKGGYDRWIRDQRNSNEHTTFIGVGFDEQLVERVPEEPHDQRMDRLILPSFP